MSYFFPTKFLEALICEIISVNLVDFVQKVTNILFKKIKVRKPVTI